MQSTITDYIHIVYINNNSNNNYGNLHGASTRAPHMQANRVGLILSQQVSFKLRFKRFPYSYKSGKRIAGGRLFQHGGPAAEKARSPKCVLILRTLGPLRLLQRSTTGVTEAATAAFAAPRGN